jgi:hypothetical protein
VSACLDRDLDLGADAVVRRDQDGVDETCRRRSNRPPKPPIAASAPGRAVARTIGAIAATMALPESMSTPASA